MNNKGAKTLIVLCAFICAVFSLQAEYVKAEEKYYLGEVINAGNDSSYSGYKEITKEDQHYGWKLGEFYVDGFTRYQKDENGNVIFLKNVGDNVVLWFDLQQNIKALNGNENLYICEDTDGFDEKYGIQQTNFGKGTLIIRHTDYQNRVGDPTIYVNYLPALVSEGADTLVKLCEEGDYEVSLLYEVKSDNFLFFDGYTHYRIDFQFSVRNGNAMVFPFDVVTGQELTNSSFTENGFYLDLAKSRYLTIDIKKQVLREGVDGLVEDTRFNRPAADGEKYTDEGIYVITVNNKYTGLSTEKKIYVGTNSVLKAHVVTGLSVSEIKAQVANGAVIDEEGNIIPASTPSTEIESEKQSENSEVTDSSKESEDKEPKENGNIIIVVVIVVLLVIFVGAFVAIRKNVNIQDIDKK